MTRAPCFLVLTATIAVLGGAWNWKLCPWKAPYWPDKTETTQRPTTQVPTTQPSTTQSPTTQTPTTQPPTTQPPTIQPPTTQLPTTQPPTTQPPTTQPPTTQPTTTQPPTTQPPTTQPPTTQPPTTQQPTTSSPNIDYCNVATCSPPQSHTRCRFPVASQISAVCGTVQSSGITSAEIKEVLDRHNVLRAQVASGAETRGSPGPQPAASNLGPLTWNDELATTALRWANQCIYAHDQCRDTHTQRVGQNIASRQRSDGYNDLLTDMVTGWYEEVRFFNSAEVPGFQNNSPAGVTGHYSQLVWANSTLIGCGVIRYNHPITTNGSFRTDLICNYSEAGNFIGVPVYQRR